MAKKVMKKRITEEIGEDGSKKTTVKEHAPRKKKSSTASNKKDSGTLKKKRMTASEREELLIENFVGLQNVMTNLSIKFGALTEEIVTLLRVYEESALSFAQGGKVGDKELLDKINSLLDQNKTIAKGLVLMEGKLRGRTHEPENIPPVPQSPPQNFSMPQGGPASEPARPKPLPRL